MHECHLHDGFVCVKHTLPILGRNIFRDVHSEGLLRLLNRISTSMFLLLLDLETYPQVPRGARNVPDRVKVSWSTLLKVLVLIPSSGITTDHLLTQHYAHFLHVSQITLCFPAKTINHEHISRSQTINLFHFLYSVALFSCNI